MDSRVVVVVWFLRELFYCIEENFAEIFWPSLFKFSQPPLYLFITVINYILNSGILREKVADTVHKEWKYTNTEEFYDHLEHVLWRGVPFDVSVSYSG